MQHADHNLLPFELIAVAAFGFPGALAGTLVGVGLRFAGRRRIRVP